MTNMYLTVHEEQVFFACRFGLNEFEVPLQDLVNAVESPFRGGWVSTVDIEVLLVKNDLQFRSVYHKYAAC